MLICHKLVASNGAEVLQACHMSQTCMQHRHLAVGSVCNASFVRGCVPLSASSSLIHHFWLIKHHHSAATPHHHSRCMRQLSYQWKLHACRANNNYCLYFLLYVFDTVFNCIIQNNSYCLH